MYDSGKSWKDKIFTKDVQDPLLDIERFNKRAEETRWRLSFAKSFWPGILIAYALWNPQNYLYILIGLIYVIYLILRLQYLDRKDIEYLNDTPEDPDRTWSYNLHDVYILNGVLYEVREKASKEALNNIKTYKFILKNRIYLIWGLLLFSATGGVLTYFGVSNDFVDIYIIVAKIVKSINLACLLSTLIIPKRFNNFFLRKEDLQWIDHLLDIAIEDTRQKIREIKKLKYGDKKPPVNPTPNPKNLPIITLKDKNTMIPRNKSGVRKFSMARKFIESVKNQTVKIVSEAKENLNHMYDKHSRKPPSNPPSDTTTATKKDIILKKDLPSEKPHEEIKSEHKFKDRDSEKNSAFNNTLMGCGAGTLAYIAGGVLTYTVIDTGDLKLSNQEVIAERVRSKLTSDPLHKKGYETINNMDLSELTLFQGNISDTKFAKEHAAKILDIKPENISNQRAHEYQKSMSKWSAIQAPEKMREHLNIKNHEKQS